MTTITKLIHRQRVFRDFVAEGIGDETLDLSANRLSKYRQYVLERVNHEGVFAAYIKAARSFCLLQAQKKILDLSSVELLLHACAGDGTEHQRIAEAALRLGQEAKQAEFPVDERELHWRNALRNRAVFEVAASTGLGANTLQNILCGEYSSATKRLVITKIYPSHYSLSSSAAQAVDAMLAQTFEKTLDSAPLFSSDSRTPMSIASIYRVFTAVNVTISDFKVAAVTKPTDK